MPYFRPPSLRCVITADVLGNSLRRALFANVVSSDRALAHIETANSWSSTDLTYAIMFTICVAMYASDQTRAAKTQRLRRSLSVRRENFLHAAEFVLLALALIFAKDVNSCT